MHRSALAYLLAFAPAAASLGCKINNTDPDAGPTYDSGGPPPVDASGIDVLTPCQEAPFIADEDFGWIKARIFSRSCVFLDSCHNANPNADGDLHLTPDLAFAELVNHASGEVPALDRVTPGDCENSYIYQKITNGPLIPDMIPGTPPIEPDPMPPSFDITGTWVPLCQPKIDLVCRWINAGAPNDVPGVDAGVPDADVPPVEDADVPDAEPPADAEVDAT